MEDYKVGALIEDFQSKLDVVVEGIKINRDLIEKNNNELKSQGELIDTIGIKLVGLEKGQANLESGQEIIKDDLTEVKNMLHRKVDVEEFERLEKRVIKLERLVNAV